MTQRRKRWTRLFTWASNRNKGKLNLRNYSNKILEAVDEVLPNRCDIVVAVGVDDFIIDSVSPILPEDFKAICKKIAQTKAIGRLATHYHYKNDGHSVQIFKGTDISM